MKINKIIVLIFLTQNIYAQSLESLLKDYTTKMIDSVIAVEDMVESYTPMAISNEEAMLRVWKALGVELNNDILQQYLRATDKNWRNYAGNEFELLENMNNAKILLESKIEQVEQEKVFYYDFYSYFEDYDFENQLFPCNPWKKYYTNNNTEIHYYYGLPDYDSYLNIHGYNNPNINMTIDSLDGFKGIGFTQEEAKSFLEQRKNTTDFYQGQYNRKIYIRVYFSQDLNDIESTKNFYNDVVINMPCKPILIRVFDDRCYNNLIYEQILNTYNDNQIKTNYYGVSTKSHWEENGYKSIINWNLLNIEKCIYENIVLHGKIIHSSGGADILAIKFYSNYPYKIYPGAKFQFINKYTGDEYPLAIYDTDIEGSYTILKMKITKETAQHIIEDGCNYLKLNMDGQKYYQIDGGDGAVSKGEISKNYEYIHFTLENEFQNLVNILKDVQ
jgi:hypothetical protein